MKQQTMNQSVKNQDRRQEKIITNKAELFSQSIRQRERQKIFSKIRKQYEQLWLHQNKGSSPIQPKYVQEYPLISRTLQKYSQIAHNELYLHIEDIQQHLLDNNIYLSTFMEEQRQQEDELVFDQQSLLVHDLFYLTFEHEGRFVLPRQFKFVRNGNYQVATYVAVVSHWVLPQELAYWLQFMSQQDVSLAYSNIISTDYVHANGKAVKQSFHYQSWINHPSLRNRLLIDFSEGNQAAILAIKQIMMRNVHPDRLKNSKGENLYDLLMAIFNQEIEGMRPKLSQDSSDFTQGHGNLKYYMEIAMKVLHARMIENMQYQQLFSIVSKIMVIRVHTQTQVISPLFCQWAIDSTINHKLKILTEMGYEIMIDIMRYDPTSFTIPHNPTIKCQCQLPDPWGHKFGGKVCETRLIKLQETILPNLNKGCQQNTKQPQQFGSDQQEPGEATVNRINHINKADLKMQQQST